MNMIGHNSAGFGEQLRADVETVLSDDHKAVFHYAQWHIGDYILGTDGMSLESEGAYMRFLMRLYQRGKPLPDDDRFMSVCMNLSLRVWRRIRDALVGFGKIIARNGCLTNARFEMERTRRSEEMKKKADAANKRWLSAKVSPKFAPSLDETSGKLGRSFAKKDNEINEDAPKVHMLTNNQYPIEEERPPIVPHGGDEKSPKRSIPEEYPNDFEEFWKLYPRREGKAAALKSWQRLSMPQKRKAYVSLKTQISELIKRAGDMRGNFCPLPATWINQGRFDDDPAGKPSFVLKDDIPLTRPMPREDQP